MVADADDLAAALDGVDDPDGLVPDVLRDVGESFLNYQVIANREQEQRAELARTPDVVATVPYFDHDIADLAGLLRLGDAIWR